MYDFSLELNDDDWQRMTGGSDSLGALVNLAAAPVVGERKDGKLRIHGNNAQSRKMIRDLIEILGGVEK
jgi:hypothetical protein